MLNIIVCVKVVTDPEAPVSTFKIDAEARRALPAAGVPPVLNPYDENSLEAAIRIKDKHGCRITAVSVGRSLPKAVLRKCLAVGADDLVVLDDPLFQDIDSHTTALVLAEAVRKIGDFDLIFTGRMAADTNAGMVGTGLAELLGIPAVTIAEKIEVEDGLIKVERALAEGREVVEVRPPCLVTVSHEIGELRAAGVKGLMAAQKQPFTTWNAGDLSLSTDLFASGTPLRLFVPERQVNCEIIAGDTPEDTGNGLALRLREIDCI